MAQDAHSDSDYGSVGSLEEYLAGSTQGEQRVEGVARDSVKRIASDDSLDSEYVSVDWEFAESVEGVHFGVVESTSKHIHSAGTEQNTGQAETTTNNTGPAFARSTPQLRGEPSLGAKNTSPLKGTPGSKTTSGFGFAITTPEDEFGAGFDSDEERELSSLLAKVDTGPKPDAKKQRLYGEIQRSQDWRRDGGFHTRSAAASATPNPHGGPDAVLPVQPLAWHGGIAASGSRSGPWPTQRPRAGVEVQYESQGYGLRGSGEPASVQRRSQYEGRTATVDPAAPSNAAGGNAVPDEVKPEAVKREASQFKSRSPTVRFRALQRQGSPAIPRSPPQHSFSPFPRPGYESPASPTARRSLALHNPSQESDSIPPLQRFRFGRALSVTDLVSPSWCELQWSFTLFRHGRKRPTPAMKSGTRVHRALEREVHDIKPIEVQTKEDRFGLRIWNVLQGLRALRDGGVTREMEVWGEIEGQIVNGVIDEISYICPDKELEAERDAKQRMEMVNNDSNVAAAASSDVLVDQMLLAEMLEAEGIGGSQGPEGAETAISEDQDAQPEPAPPKPRRTRRRLQSLHQRTEKLYVCDVKTRASPNLPQSASFRPTLLQLMLYRFLLSQMVSSAVSIKSLAVRYSFSQETAFSDTFISQVGSLNQGFYDVPSSQEDTPSQPTSSQDPLDVLSENNTPGKLWAFLLGEIKRTIPDGPKGLGDVLKAEYRDKDSGEIRGIKTFLYDEETLLEYVNDELAWWKGEREPAGVPLEEAYKCRGCEFAEECEWRIGKVDEAVAARREGNRA